MVKAWNGVAVGCGVTGGAAIARHLWVNGVTTKRDRRKRHMNQIKRKKADLICKKTGGER